MRLPLVIKFLDCLLDTGGGVTPAPHFKGAPKLKHFNGIAAKLEPILNCSLGSTGYEMVNASNFSRDLGVASDP